MIKMGLKRSGKVFNLSVCPVVLLWQHSAQCLASHCRFAGSRNVVSLYDFSPPSPTSNLTHGIQLRLCSSSGLCGIFYEVPQYSSYCCLLLPVITLLMSPWTICAERLRTYSPEYPYTSPNTCLIESRHQCVSKEQFLSSSKVCSAKLWENSQWIIFLTQQYTLGI